MVLSKCLENRLISDKNNARKICSLGNLLQNWFYHFLFDEQVCRKYNRLNPDAVLHISADTYHTLL